MQNIRSVRGVRKEINYSELCSNAADKAQLSLGCAHLNTRSLRLLVLKWVQPKLNCALSWGLGHLSTVRNNLFLKYKISNISQKEFIFQVKFGLNQLISMEPEMFLPSIVLCRLIQK